MTSRRLAREWALQILFGLDFGNTLKPEIFEQFWADKPDATPGMRRFAQELVEGVIQHRGPIDSLLRRYAQNWDIARMARVDRNVMRLALYELLYRDDIPSAVTINEAVDIVKCFGTNESGKFVNAILDRARREHAAGAASAGE